MNRVLSLFTLSLILSVGLHANNSNLCLPGSLATYEGMSLPCGIGQLSFDNFAFPNPPSGGDTANQIWLTPGAGGFNFQQTFDNGVTFTPFTSVTPITYTIDYRYTIDPAAATSADLGMDPPSGDVRISAFYCNDTTFNSDGVCVAPGVAFRPDQLNVHTNPGNTDPCIDPLNGGNTCFDQITFQHPGFSFGNVEIKILLNGSAGSPATFDSTAQGTILTIDAPEPGSVALILGGFLLIPIRRRFSPKRSVGRI